MPNFKTYLAALCKTRTTPAEAAAASAPDWDKKITIYSGTSANPVTQTAPSDGYYLQQVNGYPSQGYNDISCPNTTRAFLAYSIESISMVRVSKGDQVTMSVLSFESIAARTLNFIPCIGGGYRSLLKALQSGGAACLRLKTTFARFFNNPASKLFRQRQLFKQPSLTVRGTRLFRRVMGTRCLLLQQANQGLSKLFFPKLALMRSQQAPRSETRLQYPSKKALNSVIGFLTRKTLRPCKFAFSRSLALFETPACFKEVRHAA